MGPSDLQRYNRLLLAKHGELSSALGETQSRVPAAGGLQGDLLDQATADSEAELQIRLHKSDGRLLRAIVLHAVTIPRLPQLAEFIYRNLTFAEHVALMGLENIGYAPRNMDQLWIDPYDYQDQLESAVEILSTRGMNVSIYNHQLCVLRKSLWKFARKSISDWKNIYIEECEHCGVRGRCGGFFKWATKLHSAYIHPLPAVSDKGTDLSLSNTER